MFETAVLTYGPAGKRVWTTCMGVTGEALLLGCAALAPMIWPQMLPRTQTVMTWLLPPAPVTHQAPPDAEPPRIVRALAHPVRSLPEWMFEPRRIPDRIAILVDPPGSEAVAAVEGASLDSYRDAASGLLDSIVSGMRAAPAVVEAPAVRAASPAVQRIKVGSGVRMARPLYHPAPAYPALAKMARISGTVELLGVIGVDGRMRELRVLKGHPLLAGAALEAVRQWVYEPTRLNGEPVEVEAPITVTFHLE